jgi:hypothetical protein
LRCYNTVSDAFRKKIAPRRRSWFGGRGTGGRGILVVAGRDGTAFLRHNGQRLTFEDLRTHLSDILSGMYSLGGRPDDSAKMV